MRRGSDLQGGNHPVRGRAAEEGIVQQAIRGVFARLKGDDAAARQVTLSLMEVTETGLYDLLTDGRQRPAIRPAVVGARCALGMCGAGGVVTICPDAPRPFAQAVW
jgi:hypothetical protein